MNLIVRQSEKSDLLTPLYSYIRTKSNESDLTSIMNSIQDMNNLRMTIMQYTSFSEEAVNDYLSYYEYLDHLFYALPFRETIKGLEFKWNDLYNRQLITISDINVERGNILLNLASMYYIESYKCIKGTPDIEDTLSAINYIKKSLSIVTYISNSILPILSGSPSPLELTPNGLLAIKLFLNAYYYDLSALTSYKTGDAEFSLCYIQQSYKLYSECIELVQQLPVASSSIIQKLQFTQLYNLLRYYVLYIQFCVKENSFLDQLPKALYHVVINQLTCLCKLPLADTPQKNAIQFLQKSVKELSTCKALQHLPEEVECEVILANIPVCEVESPPPFSYLHKYPPLFDILLPADILIQVNSLKKKYMDFCSQSIYAFRGQLQDLNHNILSLNLTSMIDSVTEPRSFLISSISKVDVLHSSGELGKLNDQFTRIKEMRKQCISRIEYLKREVEMKLMEEKRIKAEHPTFEENTDYLNNIQKWLEETSLIIQSKDEGLVMFSQYMNEYQKCFTTIQEKRKQLDTMMPLNCTPALQTIIEQLKEKNQKMTSKMQRAEMLIKKIEKLTANELSIRMTVRFGIVTHKQEEAQLGLFSRAQNLVKDINDIINGVASSYSSVKHDCELFEEEMKNCHLNSDQRDLLESINNSDRLFQKNMVFIEQTYPEFEKLMDLTAQLMSDLQNYQQQVQKMLTPMQDIQDAGEEIIQPIQKSGKSWACSICGVLNDSSLLVCDGCMQRRI